MHENTTATATPTTAFRFDTKVVVVLRDDLLPWQELSITAILMSGIATSEPDLVGENYRDADGNDYLPMLRQPVLVMTADAEVLTKARTKALDRGMSLAVYTEEPFSTGHDAANREAVASVATEDLNFAGVALMTCGSKDVGMDESRTALSDQLSGCRVVLTAQRKAEQFATALERHGATIVHASTLSVIPNIDDPELVARTLALIDEHPDIVVVTTGVGFNGWAEVAESVGLGEQWHAMLAGARIIARGPKARGAIQAAGLTPDWVAESETNTEIQQVLLGEGVLGRRIAVQHHGAGADGLDEAFAAAGAEVSSLVVYRWGPAPDPGAVVDAVGLVADRQCDAVAFTSAPGATAFLDAARDEGLLSEVVAAFTDEHGVLAAAVGNVTAAPLAEHGIKPLIPERFRLGALVRAMVDELIARRR